MDTNDRKQSPESYSADYRSAYREEKKKSPPPKKKAEKKRASSKMPQSPRKDPGTEKTRMKKKVPAPPSEPRCARRENETELDDFLPEGDDLNDESLMAKWDDGLETQSSEAPEKPEEKPKRRGRHRYGIFAGALVLILALVGVGFLATSIGMKIHSALTDDTKLRGYDKFLTVVVAQDPQPFASPDRADPNFILNASLWQCMTGDGTSSYTDYDDAGRTLVPLGDVVDACHQLFGPDCQLQPKNPSEETFFVYDSQNAQFHVALYSLDSTYTPYTESAKKKDGMEILRVGYVPPSDSTRAQSGTVSSGTAPKPVKYMEYDLKTNSSTQQPYVYAVKTVPEQ